MVLLSTVEVLKPAPSLWNESMRTTAVILGGIIHSIPLLMGFANRVWEFVIHPVKTEHMTSCKSSDRVHEKKYVAPQKACRVGCVKPVANIFYLAVGDITTWYVFFS